MTITTRSVPSVPKGKQKRFYLLDKCYYSHLDFPTYQKKVNELGWYQTTDVKKADMVISSYWKHLLKYSMMKNKKLLLWTHEPYHDWHNRLIEPIGNGNQKVHVLNVYTPAPNKVFNDNYRYFRWGSRDQMLLLSPIKKAGYKYSDPAVFAKNKLPLLALSTKYAPAYYQGNKATLLPVRYEIIEWGLKNNKARVWGRNWDKAVVSGNSRGDGNREQSKAEILGNGYFNIALENTSAPHYVSEKIWEAIVSYCLPIYWSNATIYEAGCMPQNSFIDARLVYQKYGRAKGAKKIYEIISQMSHAEYIERMNRCIIAFNSIARRNVNRGLLTGAKNHQLHIVDYSRNWASFRRHFR